MKPIKLPNKNTGIASLRGQRPGEGSRRRVRRTAVYTIVGAAAVAAVAFSAGPRVDTRFTARPVAVPDDVETYISRSESAYHDLTPGTEKKIVWANAAHARTPLAFVYLHGFSATRQETYPLSDEVAKRFGANLYYPRLTGHGRNGAALAQATVNDWLNDALEAVAIGRRLGERVVVIGTSTGGTLATWLALQQPDLIAVLISPNFEPADHRADLLTWPWAAKFVPAFFGAERHRNPRSDAARRYWTSDYPTVALIPMMGLVKLVRESPLESITAPMLVIYSKHDDVVDAAETERAFARIGSREKALVAVPDAPNANRHVLAGDIMAPANTAAVAELISQFVEKHRQ